MMFIVVCVLIAVSFAYRISYRRPLKNASFGIRADGSSYCSILLVDRGVLANAFGYGFDTFGFNVTPSDRWTANYTLRQKLFPFVGTFPNPSFRYFGIPLWNLAAPLAVLAFMLRHWRRRYRPGYCERCGYDLFGHRNGRCTECDADNADVLQREKDIVLACPQCRSVVTPEAHLHCLVCGATLDAEELAHEGFHRNAIRPLMPRDRHRVIHELRIVLQCLRPRVFWNQLVVDPPLTARPLVTLWFACTMGIILVLSVLSWHAIEMPSVSFLFTFILGGLVLPPMCCLSVFMFRNPKVRGDVSGTNIILCYAYSMPVFAIALMFCFLVNVLARTGFVVLIGSGLSLCLWTYAVAMAFVSYPPVRRMLGVMLATHFIAPIALIILLFGIVVAYS